MAGMLHVFYGRLLKRRPQEVTIVLLFLVSIVLFQLVAPGLFRTDDDSYVKRGSRESKLTRREAIWEVVVLQEEVKQLRNKVASLEAEIEALKAPPNETVSLKESYDKDEVNVNHIPFSSFDKNGLHVVNNGLFNSAIISNEKGVGNSLAKDFNDMGQYIIRQYNINQRDGIFYKSLYQKAEKGIMKKEDFWIGMFRIIPLIGVEYQLMFKDPSPDDVSDDNIYSVTITKPFKPPDVNQVAHLNSIVRTINIVLPLQGRHDIFRKFLANLASVKSSTNFELHLTVAHIGVDGLDEVNNAIKDAKNLGLYNVNVVTIESNEFNKGLAIQRSVEQWKNGNDIMFMCDVDVHFGQDFLKRCAFHTAFGKAVYFPIVFSRYNPDVVSFFAKNNNASEMKISSETGYWREYGYGMYCIYYIDYLRAGGHRLWKEHSTDKTWGYEDVYFYDKIVQNEKLRVIRAPDPDITHNWHRKECALTLAPSRLKACHSSWVASEGSHKQLGLLHIGDIYSKFKSGNHSLSEM